MKRDHWYETVIGDIGTLSLLGLLGALGSSFFWKANHTPALPPVDSPLPRYPRITVG